MANQDNNITKREIFKVFDNFLTNAENANNFVNHIMKKQNILPVKKEKLF